MANTQINITANGTKTLATAGKYCDRNIDVNVAVKPEPTQFVNVLAYADSLDLNTRLNTNGTVTTTNPKALVAVTLNLNNLPGGNPLKKNTNYIRFRGCTHVHNVFAQSEDGVTYTAKGLPTMYHSIDEYGDLVYSRGYITGPYVKFNIGLAASIGSSNTALPDGFDPVAAGCIVTFNEPIGNGGYTG